MPSQKFAGVAVDHQCQRGPAITTCPDPAEVRGPALVGRGGDRRHGLNTGPHADRPLANLPSLDLEDPLHRVFVEAQKPSHGPVTEGRFLLDHGLDRLREAGIDLGRCFGLNRPGFTGGQNSRRIARYGTDIKEEDLEALFA